MRRIIPLFLLGAFAGCQSAGPVTPTPADDVEASGLRAVVAVTDKLE